MAGESRGPMQVEGEGGSRAKMAGSRKGEQGRAADAPRAHRSSCSAHGWGGGEDSSPSPGPDPPDSFLLPPTLQVTAPTPEI